MPSFGRRDGGRRERCWKIWARRTAVGQCCRGREQKETADRAQRPPPAMRARASFIVDISRFVAAARATRSHNSPQTKNVVCFSRRCLVAMLGADAAADDAAGIMRADAASGGWMAAAAAAREPRPATRRECAIRRHRGGARPAHTGARAGQPGRLRGGGEDDQRARRAQARRGAGHDRRHPGVDFLHRCRPAQALSDFEEDSANALKCLVSLARAAARAGGGDRPAACRRVADRGAA